MHEFEADGDTSSSQDFDYDWADESVHLMDGHKWVPYVKGEDSDEIAAFCEEMGHQWEVSFKKYGNSGIMSRFSVASKLG